MCDGRLVDDERQSSDGQQWGPVGRHEAVRVEG
jgi:hypothetical protein